MHTLTDYNVIQITQNKLQCLSRLTIMCYCTCTTLNLPAGFSIIIKAGVSWKGICPIITGRGRLGNSVLSSIMKYAE